MPVAGQILATVSIVAIVVPATIAPILDSLFFDKRYDGTVEEVVAMLLLVGSFVPLRREIVKEWRNLSCRRQRKLSQEQQAQIEEEKFFD